MFLLDICTIGPTGSICLALQALDGDFSEENRNRCRVATAPLIEAVENLTTFASNPEFASVPAKISNEVWIWEHFFKSVDSFFFFYNFEVLTGSVVHMHVLIIHLKILFL